MKNIKVSILMSTYNWPEALELSVRGIFNQTVLPHEIVIADDGSTDETRRLIDRLKAESPVPVIHVWHEDKGFRKTIILNMAIAKMTGDYIVQLDGDVIPSRHFISDHISLAEKNYFVCGSRVKLSPEITKRVIDRGTYSFNMFNMPLGYVMNGFRSRLLRNYMALRYARKVDHLRGCNMAFWRSDIIKVNGFNEDLMQWGHEDGEIAWRLHFAGVKKKALKMGGCVYHLYHKESSRDNEQRHFVELEKVKTEHLKWCNNGIDKYLKPRQEVKYEQAGQLHVNSLKTEPQKKVLFLISRFLDGGIDTMLAEYLNNLSNLTNHQITLGININMGQYEVYKNRLPEGVEVLYFIDNNYLTWYKRKSVKSKNKFIGFFDELILNPNRRLLTKMKLKKLMNDYDVVVDFDSTFGSLIDTDNKAKKICFFHFSLEKELQRSHRHTQRRIKNMQKYDHIVVISDAMLREAQKIAPSLKDKFVRIYNFVNVAQLKEKSELPVDDVRITKDYMLAIERLEETQKDITTLIDAYALLKKRHASSELPLLYIIGEGKDRQKIEQRIVERGVSDDVQLLGFISNPFPWMLKAVMVVHSAKFEGLPTVLIEALMLDKLIVSSDCPTGPAEILDNGRAGLLVPVGDAVAFADAMERMLYDEDLRNRIKQGMESHKKIFLAENNITSLEKRF